MKRGIIIKEIVRGLFLCFGIYCEFMIGDNICSIKRGMLFSRFLCVNLEFGLVVGGYKFIF